MRRRLAGEHVETLPEAAAWPKPTDTSPAAWLQAKLDFGEARRALRQAVASFPEARLGETVPGARVHLLRDAARRHRARPLPRGPGRDADGGPGREAGGRPDVRARGHRPAGAGDSRLAGRRSRRPSEGRRIIPYALSPPPLPSPPPGAAGRRDGARAPEPPPRPRARAARGGRPRARHRRRGDGEGGRLLGRSPPLRARLRLGRGGGRPRCSWRRAASGGSEAGAVRVAGALGLGTLAAGLAFFGILGVLGALLELPFDLYATFRIEEKHGFNRQTLGGFFLDRLKGTAIAVVLGGPVLAAILWLMERMGPSWWLWAWGVTTAFSLFAAWIYPTVLAPLFNKLHSASGRRAQGRDPRPRPPHRLPGGRHLGHGRLAPHRPRQRLLHRRLRPEADRPLRHPPRGDGPARGGGGARARARPLQAAPRALGHPPRHRHERPRLLRAEPLPAPGGLLRRLLRSSAPPTARSRSSASGSGW